MKKEAAHGRFHCRKRYEQRHSCRRKVKDRVVLTGQLRDDDEDIGELGLLG